MSCKLEKFETLTEKINFICNTSVDILCDEYTEIIHQIYNNRPKVSLSKKDIEERNSLVEKILRGLLEK